MNNQQQKKLFITGGTGYIGKGVVKEFLKNNWKVLALVRNEIKATELEALGCETIIGGLSEIEILEKGATDVDGIIHCAMDYSNHGEQIQNDFNAVDTFVKIAKRNAEINNRPITFIYTSGTLVLGEGDEVRDEYSPYNPHHFVTWRPAHEQKVLDNSDNTPNMTTAVIRPTWVYGHNSGLTTDYLNICKNDKKIYQINENNNAYTNFIHLDDISKLYYLIVNQNKSGLFHATDNNYLSVQELFNHLKSYYNCEVELISLEEGLKLFGFGAYMQILNQKITTKRSLEIGWEIEHKTLLDNLEN